MSFALQSPLTLWLLSLLPLCALIALRFFRPLAPFRRLTAILARCALLTLIVLLLAGLTSIRTTQRLAVVALIDSSGSIQTLAASPVPAQQRIREFLKRASSTRTREDLLGIVLFDGSATVIATPRAQSPRARLSAAAPAAPLPGADQNALPDPDRDAPRPPPSSSALLDADWEITDPAPGATDIAGALRLGAALLPSDAAGRLLLFSDGVETTGDARAAARTLGASAPSIPIDVVPLRTAIPREVIVTALDAPPRAAAGAGIDARVTLDSTIPSRGTLRILVNGEEVALNPALPGSKAAPKGRVIDLPAGTTTVILPVPLGSSRVQRLEAIFEPAPPSPGAPTETNDTIAANNRAEALTLTPGGGEVLIVSGVSEAGGATLAATLRAQGLTVREISPEGFPRDLVGLQPFDAVILQNASAVAIGPAGQLALQRYVAELGGGLAMIGGPDSFGAGAWRATPVEPILPVKLDLPEKLVTAAAAVVIIMDTSGSMGWTVSGSARTQQEIANEGAAMAVRALHKDDLIGIIEFASSATVVKPLGLNTDPETTAQAVLGLSPNGGTNLPPALEAAQDQLKNAKAKIKHVIVLSDGMSMQKGRIPALTRALKADGVTVSTIAVGDDADTDMMDQMARIGGGAFYRVTDPNVLPRVFLRAIQVVRTPMIREEPFTPVLTGDPSPITAGLPADIPPLGGLVLTEPRPTQENGKPTGVSYPLVTPAGEPVLATWSVGLGQVAAFTSDAHRWARQWLDWPGYTRLWLQLVRAIQRPDTSRAAELTLTRSGQSVTASLELSDETGRPRDLAAVDAFVYAPDGTRAPLRMTQVAPGLYEGRFDAARDGNYLATMSPSAPNGAPGARGVKLAPVVGGVVIPPGVEYRTLEPNLDLLRAIATESGGREFALETFTPALFERAGLTPRQARTPLLPLLLVWTVALLLVDVATRRVAWDRLITRKFADRAPAPTAQQESVISRTVGRRRGVSAADADPNTAAPLGAAEAQALITEAARRRAAGRFIKAEIAAPAASADRASNEPPVPAASPEPTETPLQAAKRRARERAEGY